MKYALIGCGRIAINHVKAVLNNGFEFIVACDINMKEAYKKRYLCRFF